jgi:hypothetical protein
MTFLQQSLEQGRVDSKSGKPSTFRSESGTWQSAGLTCKLGDSGGRRSHGHTGIYILSWRFQRQVIIKL